MDRAVLSLKAQRKKLEDQSRLVRLWKREERGAAFFFAAARCACALHC
jgi:hypothetical protein